MTIHHILQKKKKRISISQTVFISDYIKQLAQNSTSASLSKTVQTITIINGNFIYNMFQISNTAAFLKSYFKEARKTI